MLAYMYPMPSVSGRLQFGSVDRDPLGGSRVVLTFLTLLKHWQSFEPGSCLLSFSKHLSIYNRTIEKLSKSKEGVAAALRNIIFIQKNQSYGFELA